MESITSTFNGFVHFQNTFNHTDLHAYMSVHDEVPVLFSVLYLWLIFGVPDLIKNLPPATYLELPVKCWNLFLGVFSAFGAYFMAYDFIQQVYANGFWWSICTEPQHPTDGHVNGASGLWLALFVLSKVPEMLDTVFLVLRKREVIFLHWWHHCSVMLFCWHAYVNRIGPGWWFATINYLVHAIMYNYYFLMCFKSLRKYVKPIAPFITTIQLVQMFAGMFVMLAQRYFKENEDVIGKKCLAYNEANSRMGLGMYASYAVLFGFLFRKLYCVPMPEGADGSVKKPRRSGAADDAENVGEEGGLCNAAAEAMKNVQASTSNVATSVNKGKKVGKQNTD